MAKIKHLFCESENGITMQFYVVIIATLLMHLHTGVRPSVYSFVLSSSAAAGDLVLEKVPECWSASPANGSWRGSAGPKRKRFETAGLFLSTKSPTLLHALSARD